MISRIEDLDEDFLGRLSARLQTLPFKAKIEEFIGSSYSR
jgi:hypothetical protein